MSRILYFDANALLKRYLDEVGSLNLRRMVANESNPILISSLTQLEVVGVLARQARIKQLNKRRLRRIIKRISRDIGTQPSLRPFHLIPFPTLPFKAAETILIQQASRFGIGTNDALHLAIMQDLATAYPDIVLVTSDQSMQNVCNQLRLAFTDPEQSA